LVKIKLKTEALFARKKGMRFRVWTEDSFLMAALDQLEQILTDSNPGGLVRALAKQYEVDDPTEVLARTLTKIGMPPYWRSCTKLGKTCSPCSGKCTRKSYQYVTACPMGISSYSNCSSFCNNWESIQYS
jgi:hypothetical protein